MFKIDLHVHSKYSLDCFMEVEKIVNVAKRKGLNGIALTDHNTVDGWLNRRHLSRDEEFAFVPGCEISCEEGHIIGLFLTDSVDSNESLEVVDMIKDQGGISVLAHPYKYRTSINQKLLGRVDGIEVFNGRIGLSQNRRAQEMAEKYQCALAAGSDAHFYPEIGRGMVIANDGEELRKSILKRRVKVVENWPFLFAEPLSQAIGMVRTRNPKLLYRVGLAFVYPVREFLNVNKSKQAHCSGSSLRVAN